MVSFMFARTGMLCIIAVTLISFFPAASSTRVIREHTSGTDVFGKKNVVINLVFQDILKRGSELLSPPSEQDEAPCPEPPPTTSTTSTTTTTTTTGANTTPPTSPTRTTVSTTSASATTSGSTTTTAATDSSTSTSTTSTTSTASTTTATTTTTTTPPQATTTTAPPQILLILDLFQRQAVTVDTIWPSVPAGTTGNVPGTNNSQVSNVALSVTAPAEWQISTCANETFPDCEGFQLQVAAPGEGSLSTTVQYDYRFSCGLNLGPTPESLVVQQSIDALDATLESATVTMYDQEGKQLVFTYNQSSASPFDLSSLLADTQLEQGFGSDSVVQITVVYQFAVADNSTELNVLAGALLLEGAIADLQGNLFPMNIDPNPAATQGVQEARLPSNPTTGVSAALASQAVLPHPGTVDRLVALGVQERGVGIGDVTTAFAMRQLDGSVLISLGQDDTPATPSITYATSFDNCTTLLEGSPGFPGWYCQGPISGLALPRCSCSLSQGPGFQIQITPMGDPASFQTLVGAFLSTPSGDSQPMAFRVSLKPDEVDLTTTPPTFSYSIVDASFSPPLNTQSGSGYSSFSFFFQRPGGQPLSGGETRFLVKSITRKCVHASIYDLTLDSWNNPVAFPTHMDATDVTITAPILVTNEIPATTTRSIAWGPDDTLLPTENSTMLINDLSPEPGFLETETTSTSSDPLQNPFNVTYEFAVPIDLSSVRCITIGVTGSITGTAIIAGITQNMPMTTNGILFFRLVDSQLFTQILSLQFEFHGVGTIMPIMLGRCP